MPEDIVVDTNVFMHADDPRSPERQAASKDLLSYIDTNQIPIGIDEGKKIFGEYLEFLASSSIGRSYVAKWLSTNNYTLLSTKMSPSDSGWVGRNIADTLDKVFLKVAVNSIENDLVSHDFDDFPKRKRKEIGKRFGVTVQTADEYL